MAKSKKLGASTLLLIFLILGAIWVQQNITFIHYCGDSNLPYLQSDIALVLKTSEPVYDIGDILCFEAEQGTICHIYQGDIKDTMFMKGYAPDSMEHYITSDKIIGEAIYVLPFFGSECLY